MNTCENIDIPDELVIRQINSLVNRFYKILPIKESGETTLRQYEECLLREMLGFQHLIVAIRNDDRYATLLSTLKYHIDNDPEVKVVKSDVFKCIGILKDLQKKYCKAG